jgi:RNA polymerase sigma-70 factor (ECF subfamily)
MPDRPFREAVGALAVRDLEMALRCLPSQRWDAQLSIERPFLSWRAHPLQAAIHDLAASDMEMARARAIEFPTPMIDPQVATAATTRLRWSRWLREATWGIRTLVCTGAGRVYAVCMRMTGDPQRAREFTHDAFVRAWERLSTFRGEAAFETWMHRLAVNVVLTVTRGDRRREARIVATADEPAAESDVALSRPAPDMETRIDLERAIAALPRRAREVFVLHDVEGYRHEEIADRLSSRRAPCALSCIVRDDSS